jgi:hypothetical protein
MRGGLNLIKTQKLMKKKEGVLMNLRKNNFFEFTNIRGGNENPSKIFFIISHC